MRLVIDEDAQEEARQHVAWYAERDISIAKRLEELIVNTLQRIATDANQFPLMEIHRNPGDIRRARLTGFPIVVVYQLLPDRVLVAAFQHTSRRPGYWRSRLES